MGRLESLSAWALGRGHYEEELIRDPEASGSQSNQQYNSRGHPRNSRTKRKEKDNVRAANEVMQTTGVVEDAEVAKLKAIKIQNEKMEETVTALEVMSRGVPFMAAGMWGVIGLRRRVLLYRPYSEMSLVGILKHEIATKSLPTLIWAGLPTFVVHHATNLLEDVLDDVLEETMKDNALSLTYRQQLTLVGMQKFLQLGFAFICLHLRLFSTLQQLNLIAPSRWLPTLGSFVPFSSTSPLRFPPLPSSQPRSILQFATALFITASPMMIIYSHGEIREIIKAQIYNPIYQCLPRPIGDSMFAGTEHATPTEAFDTPDRPATNQGPHIAEDGPTLRALEGLPDRVPAPSHENERAAMSDEEEEDQTTTTLISFDVEATEPAGASEGTWSAELRSAQEPVISTTVKYRTTGLYMLPSIMATQGIREVVAGIIALPVEAIMLRVIGRAYRLSAGLEVGDIYNSDMWMGFGVQGYENLFGVFSLQVVVMGVLWGGIVGASQYYAERDRRERIAKENEKAAESEGEVV